MVKNILIFILTLLPAAAWAQTQANMYQMYRTMPMASELNPALMPDFRVNIAVASPYLNLNSPLSISDLGTIEGNTLRLDDERIYDRIQNFNSANFNTNISLLHLGIRGAKSYFSLNVNAHLKGRASISPDLIGWAFFGPADERNGGRLDLSKTGLEAMSYAEIGLNYAYKVNNNLTVGARVKYLQGLVHLNTELNTEVTVNQDEIEIENKGMQIQAAGLPYFATPNPEEFGFEINEGLYNVNEMTDFLGSKNRGFAIDLGATYMINKRLTVSAALNDLGAIAWKDENYIVNYTTPSSTISFKGIEAGNLEDLTGGMDTYTDDLTQQVEEGYTLQEEEAEGYTTMLAPKYYFGASYGLNKFNYVNALFHGHVENGSINPALTLGYNLQLGRYLNTVVNWSIADGRFVNAGAGFSLNLFGLQFYAISDNVLTPLISLNRTNKFDVRAGISFQLDYLRKGL